MNWTIVIRRTAQSENEVFASGCITEHSALLQANAYYKNMILDSVIVVKVDSNDFSVVYKRERRCKHTNVQYNFDASGDSVPRCEVCGLVIRPIEMEVFADEER